MAFYVGSVNYYPGVFPAPTAASRGSPLVALTTSSTYWAYPGNTAVPFSGTFATRSLFTHGYVAGGYKDSTAWRSVNKTWHATDITVYCGEQLQYAIAYSAGTFSDFNGYVHGAGGGYATASTATSSYNLHTGINRTVGTQFSGANPGGPFGYTGYNPVGDGAGVAYGSGSVVGTGSWEMSVARTYCAGAVNQVGQIGYITGGPESSNCDKFYMPTEIMYTTTSPGFTATHCTAAHGETRSYWSMAGNLRYQTYSSDAWTTWSPGTSASTDGVCKILSTKLGYHYVGTSSNATAGFQKFSDSTGSTLLTSATQASLAKPTAQGEENMEMGQNWGYCLGAYNGQQNNYSFKVNYSTDTCSALDWRTQPKGHVGMSSALCSSAAATITAMSGF